MKTELFQLVSDSLISQCNQEETDTRLFIHANHAAWNGLCKITIAAHDIDVMVIALYTFAALRLVKFWIEYGVSKNNSSYQFINMQQKWGDKVCSALPYWYTSTVWNTVSSFARRDKKQHGTHGKHTLR